MKMKIYNTKNNIEAIRDFAKNIKGKKTCYYWLIGQEIDGVYDNLYVKEEPSSNCIFELGTEKMVILEKKDIYSNHKTIKSFINSYFEFV